MTDLYQRNATPVVRGALDRFPVVAIEGARRVGKSTLAALCAASRPHVATTLDETEELEAARADPRGFLARRAGGLMVIDEIQRAPGLLLEIKADVDRAKGPGCYLLTGSSDFTRQASAPDSLAGRAVTVGLGPLSQGELAGQMEDFVAWARRALGGADAEGAVAEVGAVKWDRQACAQAIARGGYPEVLPLDGRWRELWIDSYIDRLTSRDAADVAERVSPARLRAVLALIAANPAGELVKARIAQSAGISERSVTTCLDVLTALYLVASVPPWTSNLTKRQIGRAKAMVTDSGLAAHMAGLSEAALEDPVGGALGPALEAFVATELRKQRTWSASRWELAHFRDRDGQEVDLVVRFADGKVLLVEVKAAQTYRSEHFRTMRRLADRLGDQLIAGVVLALSDRPHRHAEKMWGLPVSTLWHFS